MPTSDTPTDPRWMREALQRIVDFSIRDDRSAGWHFAEVRAIARAGLDESPAGPTMPKGRVR